MNFDDTPEQAAFRAKVRAWLDANAPKHLEPELRKAGFASAGVTSEDPMAAAKAWQKKKAQAGYACPQWPKEYGGGGFSPIERVIWQQEEGPFGQLSMVFTSEEQKQKRLPPLITGEEIWCQLFSEPAAGSDLAGLRTRAEPANDGSGDWIVNGQKIWTSGAQHSDWGLLIARTDPTVPKHKGLTMFFLSMKTPGVEVRPIKQANGQSGFNEVYFTDVRIPDSQRLAGVGGGWGVAITTLMNERLTSGEMRGPDWDELYAVARTTELEDGPALADAGVRERLADWYVKRQGLRWTRFRVMTALSRGETPGPENSIGKLVAAAQAQDMAAFAMDLMDMGGVVSDPESVPMRAAFQDSVLSTPGSRIAAGTDEILKNIIAERVLGLPADVRVDKDQAFKDLPTGKR
jgi:alkylation response protein AidB-like acyl-CoA dehydrogenase